MGEDKHPRGRPVEKKIEPFPDSYENVIKSLVAPKNVERDSSSEEDGKA